MHLFIEVVTKIVEVVQLFLVGAFLRKESTIVMAFRQCFFKTT